jgi:hypothetical protein
MDSRIVTTVHQWLSKMHIPAEKEYVYQRLVSHPDFPSAFSITRLLDDLGIENGVAKIEADQLHEIPIPFLAFVDEKEFHLITDIENIEKSIINFKTRWNGVIIFAEPPEKISPSEENKKIAQSVSHSRIKWIITIAVSLFLSAIAFSELNSTSSIILTLAIIGVIISGAIVLREAGINTVISQHLCGDDPTGCDGVLHNNPNVLPLAIKPSDLSVSFFSGIIVLSWISSFMSANLQAIVIHLIAVACFISIPFTAFLIYYQWKVVKKWCTLCLIVVGLLWVMALLQYPYAFQAAKINNISILGVGLIGLFMLPGVLWFLVRSLLTKTRELYSSNIILQRIYRSPELFKAHLLSQNKIEIEPWSFDLQLGNPAASCQIVVVSSFFCGPCTETFHHLQALLANLKNDIGITIRFLLSDKENNGIQLKIMRHILQYAFATHNFFNTPEKILHLLNTWYTVKNFEKFSESHPIKQKINVDEILDIQTNWFLSANIQYTPTIFINGYELKSPYSQAALLEFSGLLTEMFPIEMNQEIHA